jgi:HlyD family secretion protein
MSFPRLQRRTLGLIAVLLPLLALFLYVALRSGPLAPIAVTVGTVESRALAPALFGIGTLQARYTYRIGPTFAGRVQGLDVHVGDMVVAGQVLGTMDPVDLEQRISAQQAAINSAQAALRQAQARQTFAHAQADRYQQLRTTHGTSEETVAAKVQELAIANAVLTGAREDLVRLDAELQALHSQADNLRLVAPAGGLVIARNADPGSTVVAGQAVLEVIDPDQLWIDTRFDQVSAEGLAADLPATITLRSRQSQSLAGTVMRIEPRADQITEEALAKIVFDARPAPLPALGELAEVTVQLPELPAAPTIPNAAIRTLNGQTGVWRLEDERLSFVPITIGRSDLDGRVQVSAGLQAGDRFVLHSEKAVSARSRIHIVTQLAGVAP